MRLSYCLLGLILLGIVSCSNTTKIGRTLSPGGSGLSDVIIQFKDFDEELKKALTHYELKITPDEENSPDECKNPTVYDPGDKTWDVSDKLAVPTISVARKCSYLVELNLGAQEGDKFVAYFSNTYPAEDGKPGKIADKLAAKTIGDRESVRMKLGLVITQAGIDAGLGRFGGFIETKQDDADVDFTVGIDNQLSLDGTYRSSCERSTELQGYYLIREVIIKGDSIKITQKSFSDAECNQDVARQIQGEGLFKIVGQSPGRNLQINLELASKTETVYDDHLFNNYYITEHPCANLVTWSLKQPTELTDVEQCNKEVAGVSVFDILKLESESLLFGLKTADKTGETKEKRPVHIREDADSVLKKQ